MSRISSVARNPAQVREEAFSWPQVYLSVVLTTLATLILELSLTRIFSVVFNYHFAFMAISIALFGLGAGGVFSYVIADWRGRLFSKLGWLAALNGVVIVGALTFVLTRSGNLGNGTLALVYFTSALPFLLAGAIVSLAISETIERVDRVYFFDLMGAAGGCLVLIPLLNGFGGPNTVIAAAILFAASGSIWFNLAGKLRGRALAVALALGLVALLVVNWSQHFIDIRYAKGEKIRNELFVKWNSFSRIAVVPERDSTQMSIIIDADAATGIANFDFDHLSDADRGTLLREGMGFPYTMRPGAKTLIIGPGGGWDVARALASGSKDITGVEINEIIADTVMREKLPHLSRHLYARPEIRIVVEDGRSFVRRSQERYQVLQATLVDTWASTAAGAFALSENNLYTTDAFYDYLTHLTGDGILALTRWGFEPPRESLRLLALARAALTRLGQNEPAKHVMVVRDGAENLKGWGARDTVLISRRPFTSADVDRARKLIPQGRMTKIYLPGDPPENEFGQFLLAPDPEQFWSTYPFDISPVDDDRPFFFYSVQPRDLWTFIASGPRGSADYKINQAVPVLFGLMGVSLGATALILALPPVLLGSRLPAERGVRQFLAYFVFIGMGYILIQVALIQKFVLFLGHPTYALIVIIFSMLVASGIGSFFSRRFASTPEKLARILVLVSILIAVLAFVAAPLTAAGIGWPRAVKFLITTALIAPAAFLMGMPFPTGLARLETLHKQSVRWAWSLNAAASVLGSAGAIFLAIYIGLRATLLVGGAMYLGALFVVLKSQKTQPVKFPHTLNPNVTLSS